MKHFFILLLTLSFSLPVMADIREVYIDEVSTKNTRSLVTKPNVFIDDALFTLSVQFLQQNENCTITITDGNGITIAQFQGVPNSNQQIYQLPILEAGSYSITISNSSNSFIGSFEI